MEAAMAHYHRTLLAACSTASYPHGGGGGAANHCHDPLLLVDGTGCRHATGGIAAQLRSS